MIDSKFDVYHFSMTNKLFIILVILEVMFFWGINKEYSGSYLSMMQKVSSNIGIIITPIGFLYLLVRKIRTGDFVINQKGVIDEASDVRIGFIPWEHIERICVSHSAPYFMKHFRLF
ncbi:MAG: hypothetical protein OEZ10_09150, partial [Gammaproteobacteria bacterium]|nr:hypothetical protein [Gammaproteobacteria bacterium]